MIKKRPFPLTKLWHYYLPKNLQMKGGTIQSAKFEKPRLLNYKIKFPKGFKFPEQFYEKGIQKDKETTLTISKNHSGKNDIIFTGNSSFIYSEVIANDKKHDFKAISQYRIQLLLEQQSIISLVSVLETFLTNILKDSKKRGRIYHNFKAVKKVLRSCGIEVEELEGLKDDEICKRAEYNIDYLFMLRNLYVHTGGIVNEKLLRRYSRDINPDVIGKLIRVTHDDFVVMRQWLSFFIQEVCRVINGYDKVWIDYLQSSGIIIPSMGLTFKTNEGSDFNINLEEGIDLVGYFDESQESDGTDD